MSAVIAWSAFAEILSPYNRGCVSRGVVWIVANDAFTSLVVVVRTIVAPEIAFADAAGFLDIFGLGILVVREGGRLRPKHKAQSESRANKECGSPAFYYRKATVLKLPSTFFIKSI